MPKYLIHQRSNHPGQSDRIVTKVTMDQHGVDAVTVSTLLCAGLELTFTSLSRAQDMCRVLQSMTSLKYLSVRYADNLEAPNYETERRRFQEEQLDKLNQQRMGLGLEVKRLVDFKLSAEDPPLRKFSAGQVVEARFSRPEPYVHE